MYDETFCPIGNAIVTLQKKLWAAKVRIATPVHFRRHIVDRLLAPDYLGDSCSALAILPHHSWSFLIAPIFVVVAVFVVVVVVVVIVVVVIARSCVFGCCYFTLVLRVPQQKLG